MKRPFIEQAKYGRPLSERMSKRIAMWDAQAAHARRIAHLQGIVKEVGRAVVADIKAFIVMDGAVKKAQQSSKEGS